MTGRDRSEAKEIQVSDSVSVVVDAEDYEWLSSLKWIVRVEPDGAIRVRTIVKTFQGRWTPREMHLLILPAKEGMCVDHINHNRLDNRRCNLRYATPSQSSLNRRKWSTSTSPYKGVHRRHNRWRMRFRLGEISISRSFATAEEAARAYDALAVQYGGAYACLNFPDEAMEVNRG